MGDTNYISAVVQVLETPKQRLIKPNVLITEFRVQLPQIRKSRVIKLTFWGKLARDIVTYYKINDYIIIEGYISLRAKPTSSLIERPQKEPQITVTRAYPFLLSYNSSNKK